MMDITFGNDFLYSILAIIGVLDLIFITSYILLSKSFQKKVQTELITPVKLIILAILGYILGFVWYGVAGDNTIARISLTGLGALLGTVLLYLMASAKQAKRLNIPDKALFCLLIILSAIYALFIFRMFLTLIIQFSISIFK